MKTYRSYSEAANEARAIAMETKQSVKVIRNQNEWIISSKNPNLGKEQQTTADLKTIFLRTKGDYVSDYDDEPF